MNREEVTLYKDLLNDTKEQLANEIIQKNRELDKLEDVIYRAIEYIPKIIISGKSEHSFNEFAIDFQQTKEGKTLLDILKGK